MNEKTSLDNFQIDKFAEEGLYLIFPDNDCISITQNNINNYFQKIWDDGYVFPPHIKSATDLEFCEHCPGNYSDEEFCVAIRPILPFLEEVDKYLSYDKVTAIIKTANPSVISITHTDLQYALRYVSLLSLIKYCETNQKFWPYYFGVSLFADTTQVLSQIYLNIFWLNNGDKNKVQNAIDIFKNEIMISDECLLRRLRLICKNDAFLNAFVQCQVSTELLSMAEEDDLLEISFETHNNKLTETS